MDKKMMLKITPLALLALTGSLVIPSSAAQGGPLGLPPFPAENPLTEEKRILGKLLFWEEQLSSSNNVSCGTCHIPESGGADPRTGRHPGPDGINGSPDDILGSLGVRSSDELNDFEPHDNFDFAAQVTARVSQSNLLAAYDSELFWDGRAATRFIDPENGEIVILVGGALESQAVEPILSTTEMAHEGRTWDDVREKLTLVRPMALATDLPRDMAAVISQGEGYPELFQRAFGDSTITARRIAFALATYQRTLVPDQTPFDLFQQGQQDAMTNAQIQGMNTFNGAARCDLCHPAPVFSDGLFHNLGIRPHQEDVGRREVTGLFADRGKFKTPSLRNVGLRDRFFHNGLNGDVNNPPPIGGGPLGEVFSLYINGGGPFGAGNLDPLLLPIGNVGPGQLANVRDFIENALTDPRVEAAEFPFDRPRLYSERTVDGIEFYGSGEPGSGGEVPEILVEVTPTADNPDFRIGVTNALAGAPAYLFIIPTTAPMAGPITSMGHVTASPITGRVTANPITLSVDGAGAGYGTWHGTRRPDPAMIGRVVDMQWWVVDPSSSSGIAKSRFARLTIF